MIQSTATRPAPRSRRHDLRPYLAELTGTFVLVFTGVGCAVLAGPQVGALGVAFAFGLAVLAMIYSIGPVSGCHVNPAVTLALWLAGKMKSRHLLGYWMAQLLGAIVAAGIVLAVARASPDGYSSQLDGLGANGFGSHSPGGFGAGAAFLAEALLTLIFVLTVLFATDARAPIGFAGLAIGLCLTLVHLVGIPVTNMSVNPARSLGPAVFVGGWALSQLWLFFLAPLLGAAAAAVIYRTLRTPSETQLTAAEAEQAPERDRAARQIQPPADRT